ncbi:hypothetical protein LEN26_001065 [Aphanomyces euteiches]|nr:hypothetical protein AeMF1_010102 [Aphanomyces euteiches]KAH9162153.1 hypothetical protein LEN26_001065 [Aphanomyces euteiches]KAH9191253.1 hypothetical protein AeNC1_006777 [Aphanomyces euteiches]
MTGVDLGDDGVLAAVDVLRVGLEIENIGERVPSSKKRLSWRFVFADSEEVHTVTLEHSRVSFKKRVRLDGKRIGASEVYTSGPWSFDFTVETHPFVPFQILIKDLNSLGLLERARANLNPDILYAFYANGKVWESLSDRSLKYENQLGSVRWSSITYCRRVHFTVDVNEHKDVRVSWLFTFGQDGAVHQLMLEDCADGSKILVLDRTSLRHDQPTDDALTLDLIDSSPSKKETWMAQHLIGEEEHELVVRVLNDRQGEAKYTLHINGCAWEDMAETDYVLQPGFYPVHSKSTGKVYYREDATKQTMWEKPIQPRKASSAATLPPQNSASSISQQGQPVVEDLVKSVDLLDFSNDGFGFGPTTTPPPPTDVAPKNETSTTIASPNPTASATDKPVVQQAALDLLA